MKRVKTARGKILDMGALATQHEKTRAVSNVPVNARGDIIDSRGNVSVPREKISKEFYKDTVPGADKEEISIKEESPPAPKKTIKKKTEPTEPQEVSREMRERNDGTMYYEVEYDDGSMEEINV
ncbi:MAG: hypothetical protein CBD74_14275 [Saprospirales bacterium TMED214]|nr:MAG: hypothetical protein CBD74_14275 [Saprospirales bacterium TMED214]